MSVVAGALEVIVGGTEVGGGVVTSPTGVGVGVAVVGGAAIAHGTGAITKALQGEGRMSEMKKSESSGGNKDEGKSKEGRAGKQDRLRELGNDPKLGSSDRGWIKQETNQIDRGKRGSIRNPPGKDLAHERGREAAKGYSYKYSNLQDRDLHRRQHKL